MIQLSSSAELVVATKIARDKHPKAYTKTVQYGKSFNAARRKELEEHGLQVCELIEQYRRHQMTTREAIARGDCVVVVSTIPYWRLVTKNQQNVPFTYLGYEMVKTFKQGTARLSFQKGTESGVIAPLSECFPPKDCAKSLTALCLHCNCNVPFGSSIVCDCLSALFCSIQCRRDGAISHSAVCHKQKECAATLVQHVRQSDTWPFVVGSADGNIVAVPAEKAIELTFIPNMLFNECSFDIGAVLFQNNRLVRQVFGAKNFKQNEQTPLQGS